MTTSRDEIAFGFETAESRRARERVAPGVLVVEPIGQTGSVHASVDMEGSWGLVITTSEPDGPVPPIRLESMSVEFGGQYELRIDGEVAIVRASYIQCHAMDDGVRDLFMTFCAALIDGLSAQPKQSEVGQLVDTWITLFWRLQTPARQAVVGLIGELVLLDVAREKSLWVQAWHDSPLDSVDFALERPPLQVEVKATTGQERIHDLSIHQARTEGPGERIFASVLVELRPSGSRVGDLAQELAMTLNGEELRLFWRRLTDICGSSLAEYLDQRFMREQSAASFRLFRALDVPRPVVELPLPQGVSGLRFRSDFSSVPPLDRSVIPGL